MEHQHLWAHNIFIKFSSLSKCFQHLFGQYGHTCFPEIYLDFFSEFGRIFVFFLYVGQSVCESPRHFFLKSLSVTPLEPKVAMTLGISSVFPLGLLRKFVSKFYKRIFQHLLFFREILSKPLGLFL